jgi:hypothetical protein
VLNTGIGSGIPSLVKYPVCFLINDLGQDPEFLETQDHPYVHFACSFSLRLKIATLKIATHAPYVHFEWSFFFMS